MNYMRQYGFKMQYPLYFSRHFGSFNRILKAVHRRAAKLPSAGLHQIETGK
ncbi:hypothetical protein [Acinetobacter pullicarnis]|uniref:hypothetical protein n=1 Tax=Acinetobacter pullicarnis TaxID=2576829 RepID=UPI00148EEDEC|nr:hypothetical protein [Acinetobacter pullicarnis]